MNHKLKVLANLKIVLMLTFLSCIDNRMPTMPIEIDRPVSISISPAAGQLIFPINGKIEMTFDEPMDISTFVGNFILLDNDSNEVGGTFTQKDSLVYFTPSSSLDKSTIYSATLKGGVKDKFNNTIEVNGEAAFSDTLKIMKTWFYTEGDYSDGGFYNVYLRDRRQGKIYTFENLNEVGQEISGLTAPEGIALSKDGDKLIVSNTAKNEVQIFDLNSYEKLAVFTVGANPTSIVVFDRYAYLISVNGTQITCIDLENLSIASQNSLSFYPGKLAIASDGNTLYTFDQQKLDLVLLNVSDYQIIKRVSNVIAGGVGGEITFDQSLNRLLICDPKGKNVKELSVANDQAEIFFETPNNSAPRQIVVSNDIAYLASDESLFKLDNTTAEILAQITLEGQINSLTVIPSNDIAYLTLNNNVVILDTKTLTIIGKIELGVTGLEAIISSSRRR